MPRKRRLNAGQHSRRERGERPRVLVTDGENVGVLAVIRGLARGGYDPWVASAHRYAPAFRSRAARGTVLVPDPCSAADAFVQKIADAVKGIGPVAILPGGEVGMLALARHRDELPAGVRFAVCDPETVARATDKAALQSLAEPAGLRVPATFSTTAEDAERRLPVTLPVVVKPHRSQVPAAGGFSGFPVRRAATREQVVAALRALPDHRGLIQHYHPGSLCGIGGVFWDGELIAAVHQRAVRTWPVGCGEMSFALAAPRDPALERSVSRMLLALGWNGLFQLQYLDTDEGRLLIDLNPRVYGSLALALGIGQNLPAIWVDHVVGQRTPGSDAYRSEVRFRNEVLDARARLAARRSTRHPHAEANGDDRTRTVNAYFERSDPMPLLAVAPMVAAKLRKRTQRTEPLAVPAR